MEQIVIVSAARTALTAFNGKFKSVSATELGAAAIRKVIENYNVKVDNVYMGCVLSAGLGQSPTRQASIAAGLDNSVNCVNVNKICGSGMMALMFARNELLLGESEIVVAGGMESMTNAPYLLNKARFGYRFGDGKIIDHMVHDGLFDVYGQCVMGEYAEETAKIYEFSKEQQDKFAINSFEKSQNAIKNSCFKNEIVSVTVKNEVIVDEDEIPTSMNLNNIVNLRPAFKENGTITAASASSLSDGAAALLVMSETTAKKFGFTPLAKIVAQASHSHAPKEFTTAPIGAIKKVLQKSNWNINDVDLFEINEAFAVVTMAAMKELNINKEKVNIFGGACSLGHPLGASGARIVVTLLNAMSLNNAKKGLATLCIGGGESVAMTFEKI